MERFWNIVYYCAYKIKCKCYYYFCTYTGLFYAHKLPWNKKRYEKRGIKDPKAYYINKCESLDDGYAIWFARRSMDFPLIVFVNGVIFILLGVIQPKSFTPVAILIILSVVFTFAFNYNLLWRKDKYQKYFKEFDKKPRKWKVKWAWISLGVFLFPFLVWVYIFTLFAEKIG